jgi:hypothetical protein
VPELEDGNNPIVVEDLAEKEEFKLGRPAQFWTLFVGAISAFLGGLCGIRGPPIILYFLHTPFPVSFTKKYATCHRSLHHLYKCIDVRCLLLG